MIEAGKGILFINGKKIGKVSNIQINEVISFKWCLYKKPKDYPHGYIARLWIGGEPTEDIIASVYRENVVRVLEKSFGLVKIDRNEHDDQCVDSTWVLKDGLSAERIEVD